MSEQPAATNGGTVDLRGAIGVQIGDYPQMHLHVRTGPPPWWTRSGYIEQVRGIAPGGGLPSRLKDRDTELAELAGFCVGDDEYLWWQAEPWAGKSALLSTFVLNPPPWVEVVAFFVAATATQSDSAAFTEALLEQLSAIVGESVPGSLTPTARDAHRRALLRAATDKVHGEDRRLVLVVDGLDEDRGMRPGSGLDSVASLLPKVCDDGLRVVVASRPDLRLPDDVPLDHPLRRGCRVRELAVSEHATEVAVLANREMTELLHGDQLHLEILGLITACGGGLTLAELEELTNLAPYRLKGLLRGVFGRTVADRLDHAGVGSARLYQFTHETLRESAVQNLGTSLGFYRDRLHAWAERWRMKGWPESTPPYLLRGYVRVLADRADVDRLVALAVDPVRHDRMLAVSGGDAAAFTEVKIAQDLVLSHSEPDLLAMAHLSIRRHDLESRNARIPTGLPAVWAAVGQPIRAESLAGGITDLRERAVALAGIAKAVAAAGDAGHARRLAADAETIAHTITDPHEQALALFGIADEVAASDPEHAGRLASDVETIVRTITDLDVPWALASVARVTDDPERARRLAAEAEATAYTITNPGRRWATLANIANVVATTGDPVRAGTIICDIADPHQKAQALVDIATAVAAAGDSEGARRMAADAETIAHTITDRDDRALALAGIAQALTVAGDSEGARRMAADAETIAHTITDRDDRALALAGIAQALTVAGDSEGARRVAADAEAIARTITDRDDRAEALADIATVVAAAGDPEGARRMAADAEAIARTITDPDDRAYTLIGIAQALTVAGDCEYARRVAADAEAIAPTITDPDDRALALANIAIALALAEDLEHARRVAADAEAIAHTITDVQALAPANIAIALALAEDPEHAEVVALAITDLYRQGQALAGIAQVVASGDPERATRLAADAEVIARTITDPYQRADTLISIAQVVASGDPERATRLAADAEVIARTITDPYQRADTLISIAQALTAAADPEYARRLTVDAETTARIVANPTRRSMALADIAAVVAATGDLERAEAIACTITDLGGQASALVAAADVTDPRKAIGLLGRAFAIGSWLTPLPVLAKLQPRLVPQIAAAVYGNERS